MCVESGNWHLTNLEISNREKRKKNMRMRGSGGERTIINHEDEIKSKDYVWMRILCLSFDFDHERA